MSLKVRRSARERDRLRASFARRFMGGWAEMRSRFLAMYGTWYDHAPTDREILMHLQSAMRAPSAPACQRV